MSTMPIPIPLSVKVWLRRDALDGRLARGASPDEAPELAARAAQLLSPRSRLVLARGLERAVEAVGEHGSCYGASAPLDRPGIERAEAELLDLAALLRSSEPVQPRGVALVEQLLTHGDSPLYAIAPEGALREAARQARAALLLA
jgi:hypothetical protein